MRFAFTGRSGLDSGLAIVFADHSRESHLSLPKAEDPRQLVMTGQAMARSGFTFRNRSFSVWLACWDVHFSEWLPQA